MQFSHSERRMRSIITRFLRRALIERALQGWLFELSDSDDKYVFPWLWRDLLFLHIKCCFGWLTEQQNQPAPNYVWLCVSLCVNVGIWMLACVCVLAFVSGCPRDRYWPQLSTLCTHFHRGTSTNPAGVAALAFIPPLLPLPTTIESVLASRHPPLVTLCANSGSLCVWANEKRTAYIHKL